ncbi:hypothetical protein HDU67_003677 [Dinochytrium kinnereticum]|nr:hypothetical protein HDU67_003677 [Dinochytrium kinnereticum]
MSTFSHNQPESNDTPPFVRSPTPEVTSGGDGMLVDEEIMVEDAEAIRCAALRLRKTAQHALSGLTAGLGISGAHPMNLYLHRFEAKLDAFDEARLGQMFEGPERAEANHILPALNRCKRERESLERSRDFNVNLAKNLLKDMVKETGSYGLMRFTGIPTVQKILNDDMRADAMECFARLDGLGTRLKSSADRIDRLERKCAATDAAMVQEYREKLDHLIATLEAEWVEEMQQAAEECQRLFRKAKEVGDQAIDKLDLLNSYMERGDFQVDRESPQDNLDKFKDQLHDLELDEQIFLVDKLRDMIRRQESLLTWKRASAKACVDFMQSPKCADIDYHFRQHTEFYKEQVCKRLYGL